MIQPLEQIAEGFRESARFILQYQVIPAAMVVGLIVGNVIGFNDYMNVKRIVAEQRVQISKQMEQLNIINDNLRKRLDPNYVPPYREY